LKIFLGTGRLWAACSRTEVRVRFLFAAVLMLGLLACAKPQATPDAKPAAAKVVLRFLDMDAVLPLEAAPSQASGWAYMDAGQWAPLELRWKPGPPPEGEGAVGRTAPAWVLLRDPEGEVHRIVVKGPGPDELKERNEVMDPDDRDMGILLGIALILGLRGAVY
jgi:hypothetical protein